MLTPDLIVSDYQKITPSLLRDFGVTLLLCDLDNTFAPYEQPLPDEDNLAWFRAMREAGVQIVFLSNNHGERVARFCKQAGDIPFYPDAKKPLTAVARRAMKDYGGTAQNTAVLGDQIYTDVWTGKNLGVLTLMVPPIHDKTNLFFKTKRLLERHIVRRYARRHGWQTSFQFWRVKEK